MLTIILKLVSLIAFMALGYILKILGVFKKEDFNILSSLVFKVTLPCAVIVNLNNVDIDVSYLPLAVIGVIANIVCLIVGYFTAPDKEQRPFFMLNSSGFNLGSFGLPFIIGFLGPVGIMSACLFDAGNSIMCTGMNYVAAYTVKNAEGEGGGFSVKDSLKKLFSAVAFDIYIVMLVLRLMNLKVPGAIFQIASVGANANSLLAMIMLGIAINLNIDSSKGVIITRILSFRLIVCILIMTAIFFLPFYTFEIRTALILSVACPVSSLAPVFTAMLGEDVETAGTINSISIILNTVLIVFLLVTLMGY